LWGKKKKNGFESISLSDKGGKRVCSPIRKSSWSKRRKESSHTTLKEMRNAFKGTSEFVFGSKEVYPFNWGVFFLGGEGGFSGGGLNGGDKK